MYTPMMGQDEIDRNVTMMTISRMLHERGLIHKVGPEYKGLTPRLYLTRGDIVINCPRSIFALTAFAGKGLTTTGQGSWVSGLWYPALGISKFEELIQVFW